MTTKKDNFELRAQKLGEGVEETLGIPEDGFQAVSYTHLTLPTKA